MTNTFAGLGAAASMIICLAAPILHFQGMMEASDYRLVLALASVGWFVTATAWSATRKSKR